MLRGARPGSVPPDAWATVLALAALRARLRGEQALWADWEVGAPVAAVGQLSCTPSFCDIEKRVPFL